MPDTEELVVCERAGTCDRRNEHCCGAPHFPRLDCLTKGDPMYSCCQDGLLPVHEKLCRAVGSIVGIKDEVPV